MNIIKKSNLGEIKSVFNDNSSNAHYYKIIQNTFGDRITSLEFAKPIIQVSKGVIIWQSLHKEPCNNYTTLNDEKKRHINIIIENTFKEMSVLLEGNEDKNFLERIIEIPSEEAIYYTIDNNNTIKVILTEWAYTKDAHIKSEGVLKKLFSTTLKSFIVKFKSNKNELLEGINCNISSEEFNYSSSSNSEGVVKLNNLSKDLRVNITSPDANFEDVSFIIDSSEEYVIVVERMYMLGFKVITSNRLPVANTEFTFISNYFPNKKIQTDFEGFCSFQHPEKEDFFKILVNEEDELISEKLPSEDKNYTIIYDPPKEEVEEETIPLVEEKIEESIQLEFLNWRKKPIVNQSINIYGKDSRENYITNNEGIIYIDQLNDDIDYTLFMKFKGSDWKKDFTHTGASKYTFIVKMKKFLWWWIPLLFFFILLLLIPFKMNHHYTVLDKNTKTPIESASINSSKVSYSLFNTKDRTDIKGELSVEYDKAMLYKQIFERPSTDILVTKTGYENLTASVPLGFFKTRESIIYLDKLIPPPSPPIPTIPCNGGENFNESGNQTKRFDLGKSNVEFLFEYYNDTQLDIISVYCDDSTILFEVDTTTNTADFKHSELIYAPCRYIDVTVKGNSNWGIRVHCPK